jgi:hypothetical protein
VLNAWLRGWRGARPQQTVLCVLLLLLLLLLLLHVLLCSSVPGPPVDAGAVGREGERARGQEGRRAGGQEGKGPTPRSAWAGGRGRLWTASLGLHAWATNFSNRLTTLAVVQVGPPV